jgi:hypothetical protein
MKNNLDHLSGSKQQDLARIVEILFAECEDATALATQKWKKQGRIIKVILYGNHAHAAFPCNGLGEAGFASRA